LTTKATEGTGQTAPASALQEDNGNDQERQDEKKRTENVLGKHPKRHEHG
jgi:hypothetical protein